MPKKIPSSDAEDKDVNYPNGRIKLHEFMQQMIKPQLKSLPDVIPRNWRCIDENGDNKEDKETFRLLQWNVLSQGE